MQAFKQKRWVSILVFFAICGALVFWCRVELNAWPGIEPEAHAIELVERWLIATRKPPSDKDFQYPNPVSLDTGVSCWEIIQEALAANNGEFNLESSNPAGELMTANPDLQIRDVDEIYVTLKFPNGQIIDIRYYEGGLDFCAEN